MNPIEKESGPGKRGASGPAWRRNQSFLPVLVLLAVFVAINAVITRNFISTGYAVSIFINNTPLILVTIGVAVVIIGGGIDISQGAVVTILNVLFVTFVVGMKMNTVLAGFLIILLGVAIGVINGVITAIAQVPPLLSTFAMTSVLSGISYWVMPVPKSGMPDALVDWYHGGFAGIPTPVLLIALVIACWLVVKKTSLGLWLYAFGNNNANAYVSGIPVRFTQIFTYAFAGFMGGVAALTLTANTGSGDALIALSMSLQTVAACVIGGISLKGGKGGIGGAVMGSIFLCLVTITVFSTKIQPFYQNLAVGAIMLLGMVGVVTFNRYMSRGQENGW